MCVCVCVCVGGRAGTCVRAGYYRRGLSGGVRVLVIVWCVTLHQKLFLLLLESDIKRHNPPFTDIKLINHLLNVVSASNTQITFRGFAIPFTQEWCDILTQNTDPNTQNYNMTCCSVWVWNMVSNYGRMQIKHIWEYGTWSAGLISRKMYVKISFIN